LLSSKISYVWPDSPPGSYRNYPSPSKEEIVSSENTTKRIISRYQAAIFGLTHKSLTLTHLLHPQDRETLPASLKAFNRIYSQAYLVKIAFSLVIEFNLCRGRKRFWFWVEY